MDVKSKDMKVEDALPLLAAMITVEEVEEFISGESRKTIYVAADARIKEIEGASLQKQGELNGPITQPASDFKDGLQATKAAGAPPPPAPPYQGGEKGGVKIKTYVTGEDVIKQMREKGRKI